MKKNFENPVGRSYVSPSIEVIELNVEGSICLASAGFGINDWEEEDFDPTLSF